MSLRSSQCPIMVQVQPSAFAALAGRFVVNAPKFPPGAVSSRKDTLAADLNGAVRCKRFARGNQMRLGEEIDELCVGIGAQPFLRLRDNFPAPVFRGGQPVDAAIFGGDVKAL